MKFLQYKNEFKYTIPAAFIGTLLWAGFIQQEGMIKKVDIKTDQQNMLWTSPTKHGGNYSWIGNHWIPPLGVPTYTAEDMRNVFRKENSLWIGDSTARRSYATMFAIMNASNPSDIAVLDLDGPSKLFGKRGEICSNRDFGNESICRQIQSATQSYGKFDMGAKAYYKDILDFANMELKQPSLSQEYSIIVFALGVWETIRPDEGSNAKTIPEDRLLLALDALEKLASPSLTVVWRTHGFSSKGKAHGNDRLEQLNAKAKEWFQNATQHQNSNMVLVDWGEGIYRRSVGRLRIEGDMAPHYGLEARTLMAQMLTHELISSREDFY
jgi:hypothetical protein